MFDGVICKYFGGGLSVYILESNIKLVSIYIYIYICINQISKKVGGGGGHYPPMPKHSSVLMLCDHS